MKIHKQIKKFIESGATENQRVNESIDLICKDIRCCNVNITHTTPNHENISAGEIITISALKAGKFSKIILKMHTNDGTNDVEETTEMSFFSHEDIYIGEKTINSETFQLVLSLIHFSSQSRLFQLAYHKIDDIDDVYQSHNGIIHPWP